MQDDPPTTELEKATLGGGCFWCTEAVFQELEGVAFVVSGYAGGEKPDPTYREVCSGTTGHAEVVQVSFEPTIVSYRQVLEVFFATHDPTTLNQQGGDIGTQYRSVIFYHSLEQKMLAAELIADLDRTDVFDSPIVTEIAPLEEFYPAEEYHQDYYRRNPEQGYCQVIINPKLAKFRSMFVARIKTMP